MGIIVNDFVGDAGTSANPPRPSESEQDGLLYPPGPYVSGATMDTREVIDKYYACVNTGDWAGYLMLFSDDCICDEQLAGHFVGIEALRPLVDGFPMSYSRFQMFPQRVVIEGEAAVVVWRVEALIAAGVPVAYPTNPDGSTRQVIGANYFQVQNGKIVYMRTMHDSRPFAPLPNTSL